MQEEFPQQEADGRDQALHGQLSQDRAELTISPPICGEGAGSSDMEVLPGPSTLAGPSDLPCVFPGLCPPVFGQRAEACSVEEVGRLKEAIGSKEAGNGHNGGKGCGGRDVLRGGQAGVRGEDVLGAG